MITFWLLTSGAGEGEQEAPLFSNGASDDEQRQKFENWRRKPKQTEVEVVVSEPAPVVEPKPTPAPKLPAAPLAPSSLQNPLSVTFRPPTVVAKSFKELAAAVALQRQQAAQLEAELQAERDEEDDFEALLLAA